MNSTAKQQFESMVRLAQWIDKHTCERGVWLLLLFVLNLLLIVDGAFKDTGELALAMNESILLEPFFYAALAALLSAPLLANPLLSVVCWLLSQFCPAKRAGLFLAKYQYSVTEPLPALPVHQAHGSRAPPFAI
ncbi:hypothetical protein [Alteromonas lipolytica]|uniref:Uncharacterized protein n=1 Tax=Alteromonas lipolytica TaxID=1856405 RepID=A0A1E8FAM5_9ALTE|nr:hypothetical protein [Alteromonas lipolytica]OFI32982.1 hypothetical protein BFC17_01535 [Alteromonas lipolytica]